jgi:hypothetical protein
VSRKIIGVTVGTPLGIPAIKEKLNPVTQQDLDSAMGEVQRDIILMLAKTEMLNPIADENNALYTDENGAIYLL